MNGRMAKRLAHEAREYCRHKGINPGDGAGLYTREPKTGAVRTAWKWRVFYRGRKRYHVAQKKASIAALRLAA